MIRISGLDILKFLTNHYPFVQAVFNESKPEFIIDSDRFHNLITEYNITSESKITLSKLVDLKFCRHLPTGEFKLTGNYTLFLEFIFEDFVLNLPETLKNRYLSIFNYFTQLQSEISEEKIITLIQEIVKVIETFLNDIAAQTNRLLKDTEALKVNKDNLSDLTMRIQKANYWIDEYIIPLNSILDKDHPNSIVNAITQIQGYSSEKRLIAGTYDLRRNFEKLYGASVSAKNELDGTLSKLTRELLPLLDRIKTDSLILSGFYHYVENVDYPEKYIIALPGLIKRTKGTVLSKVFSSEAEFFIDQFNYVSQEVVFEENNEEIEWLPDASYFKEELVKAEGSTNFYQWCFDILKTKTENVTLSKYFGVSNILLDEDLVVEYTEGSRISIELSDATIKMPKIKVYEKLST